ncbi:MAG: class I SAM-dependent methyltransferase, partial [Phycisphaerales bacterium JB038]
MADDFDTAYRQTPHLYGEAPDQLLAEHGHRIVSGRPVLDLGSGQGRHALTLARAGYEVHALDPSAVAVTTLAQLAEREGLPIRCLQCRFQEFPGDHDAYAAVLVFGLLPILTWEDIATLRAALDSWLAPGGLAFLT